MAIILNIDTALDIAFISLAQDGKLLGSANNYRQKDHSAWLHAAVAQLMADSKISVHDLDAIGVSIGPGSYTGLRIAVSAAKGFCYALNIPLITIKTLEQIAWQGIYSTDEADSSKRDSHENRETLFCSMIDARRMEVFTAVYNRQLSEVIKPHALVLNQHSFEDLLQGHKILFLGNGSLKFENICQNAHAMFKNIAPNPLALATLTYRDFVGNNFAGLAYTEPLYLKEFFTRENEANEKG